MTQFRLKVSRVLEEGDILFIRNSYDDNDREDERAELNLSYQKLSFLPNRQNRQNMDGRTGNFGFNKQLD